MEMTMRRQKQRTVPTKADLDATVDMLRSLAKEDDSQSEVAQLSKVLELTALGHDPHTIAQQLGLSRRELADSIRALGKRFKSRTFELPEQQSTMLFPIDPDPEVLATLTPRRRKQLQAKEEGQRAANLLPPIWVAEFHESTVRKAVAAIRDNTTPSEELKALALRAASASFLPGSTFVTYPSLRATWRMIQLGQLDRFARSEDLPVRAAQTVVAAYDALESARADGVAALQRLLEGPGADELDALTVRARPLFEAPVTRLEQVLERTHDRADLADFRERAWRQFVNSVHGVEFPHDVSQLNEGQVLRVAEALGIDPEPSIDAGFRDAEAKLTELGLEEDAPWLQGVWIAASSGNREADFWKAIDRLIAGDSEWTESLK